MSRSMLTDMDFNRHQRWLHRAAGAELQLLILDAKGQGIWPEANAIPAGLAEPLAAWAEAADASLHRVSLPDGQAVLCRPLGQTRDGQLGWGGVLFNPKHYDSHPLDLDALAEALGDVLDAIFEEHQQRADLEMMTEELGARYEELHLVYSVDQHIQDHAGNYEDIFQKLLESATEHLNVDVAAVVMPYDEMNLHATALSAPIHALDLVLVEMRGDLFRFVQSSGQTVVLNAENDPRRAYIFTNMPYKVLASPVHSGNKLNAMVVLLNHANKPDFSNSDRKLCEVLANQFASLLNSYALVRRLSDFNDQIARALIEAVEAKDPYTRGHSDRVNFISMAIGRAMGLSSADMDELQWGSLLHDVGKIGIPDAVLCKPAALTPDEYTFIKVHPERSYDILRHMKQLEMAATAARHHQEQFDGRGYPHGLRGERIPLLSRIIAVADTYDSITSSRAYRPGRTHEVAMREIQRVTGTQLDPTIVKVFSEMVAQEPEWLVRFRIRREAPVAQ